MPDKTTLNDDLFLSQLATKCPTNKLIETHNRNSGKHESHREQVASPTIEFLLVLINDADWAVLRLDPLSLL